MRPCSAHLPLNGLCRSHSSFNSRTRPWWAAMDDANDAQLHNKRTRSPIYGRIRVRRTPYIHHAGATPDCAFALSKLLTRNALCCHAYLSCLVCGACTSFRCNSGMRKHDPMTAAFMRIGKNSSEQHREGTKHERTVRCEHSLQSFRPTALLLNRQIFTCSN